MEGKYLKFCPVCNKTGQNSMDWCFNEKSIEFLKGYHIFEPDGGFGKICPSCKKGVLEDSIITYEELEIIQAVSDSDRQFLEAMIELKKNDPIEYQIKMSQFKASLKQQENSKKVEDDNTLRCPTCNSTKVKKISATSKVVGASMFGLFSKTARSQFKCERCGYKW